MRLILGTTPVESNDENDFFQNPFIAASAHHRPIGAGAQYASDSDPSTVDWVTANFGTVNVGFPWGVYFAKNSTSDTLYTVQPHSGGQNLPVTLRIPTLTQTPPPPVNGNHYDNVLIIYDIANSGNIYEFYEFSWADDGTPIANFVMIHPITGKGHGTGRTGVSACGMSCVVGLTRGFEINTTAGSINHMMQFAIGRQTGEPMADLAVWPATSTDWNCDGVTFCTGHVPYGSLWALPQDVFTDDYINNDLGLTALGKKLAFQLRNYGGRIFDGANGRPSRGDQTITSDARTEHNNEMRKIYRSLRRVINDAEDQIASGGGTPIAPNTGA